MNFNTSCTENNIYYKRIKVSHTAELYTYFLGQSAIGKWHIMTSSHCRTIYLLSWAVCYWELTQYDSLTLQNYILTFLGRLLLGTDTWRVSHTAELYTYFLEQAAIGNWHNMTLSHCRTIYLLSWAACYWELTHYDFLTLQNYILTVLSSLLLGTDTLGLPHTAELYTYFFEQTAIGDWYIMRFCFPSSKKVM